MYCLFDMNRLSAILLGTLEQGIDDAINGFDIIGEELPTRRPLGFEKIRWSSAMKSALLMILSKAKPEQKPGDVAFRSNPERSRT